MSGKQRTESFGATWWGRRWRRALESLGATYPNPRLPHGRSLARKGAVQGLVVEPGRIRAQVQARSQAHDVALTLPAFADDDWETAVEALAGQLRHAAALLQGELPEDVDDTLRHVDLSLFPRPGELGSTCTCTSKIEPCAHATAVHYVLAPMLDADPFLLTRLRGRDREPLLAALRAARSGRRRRQLRRRVCPADRRTIPLGSDPPGDQPAAQRRSGRRLRQRLGGMGRQRRRAAVGRDGRRRDRRCVAVTSTGSTSNRSAARRPTRPGPRS
ncbi:hypothetical protein AB0I53_02295 [Saccharopolyspora sp. NPDC050389]|uniref:SWIM zinc finger family protein n=1 Tax=Saccharopolyspora sp. NPDC050389 TaxID=3155516 RepID=UPI003401F2BA